MNYLPGTLIDIGSKNYGKIDIASEVLDNIFQTGGLMMGQVMAMTGLEGYMVQNWVKRGFVSSPTRKLYSKRQFCRIVIINMLKESMPIDMIVKLLSYINGVLDDESDDLIDDAQLYNYFVNMAFLCEQNKTAEEAIDIIIKSYVEPVPGACKRLSKVMLIMYNAGLATKYRRKCEQLLSELG
jgi:hypothetical protein